MYENKVHRLSFQILKSVCQSLHFDNGTETENVDKNQNLF